jgi:hypothetical protein
VISKELGFNWDEVVGLRSVNYSIEDTIKRRGKMQDHIATRFAARLKKKGPAKSTSPRPHTQAAVVESLIIHARISIRRSFFSPFRALKKPACDEAM